MSRRYSDEQADFLRDYIPGHHYAETAAAFNQQFPGAPVSAKQVHAWAQNHHIRCGLHADVHLWKYSKEVRDFIYANYKGRSGKELHKMVTDKFGPVITLNGLIAFKKNHKLKSGLNTQFQTGCEPVNKGKTWNEIMSKESQERSRRTCFKQGNIPHNHVPVGTVARTPDGYLKRKIEEPDQWKYIHRETWEKHNGPIPDGMIVSFKDGNRKNCDISNLMLISMAENVRLNQKHLRQSDPNLTEAGLLVAKVITAAGKRKKGWKIK